MQANKTRFYGAISVFCAQLREMKLMSRQVSEGCHEQMEVKQKARPIQLLMKQRPDRN